MRKIPDMVFMDSRLRGNDALRLFLAALLLLIAVPAWAQTFPPLTGRVVDQANLLDPAQEADIIAKSDALEKASGRQFVVATVSSLEGRDIQDYGYRLGRHWGIGTDEKNDGVLLLVAPNERKVRIEVGYGLEPYLTDALSSVIINRAILPKFRDGDMAGGIVAGADAIIQQVSLPPEEAAKRQQQMLAAEKKDRGGRIPFALIFWIAVALFILVPMFLGGRRGRRYRGGHGPVVIWGPGDWGGGSGGSGWGGGSWGGGDGGGGFSGGGGSFGGGGAGGSW